MLPTRSHGEELTLSFSFAIKVNLRFLNKEKGNIFWFDDQQKGTQRIKKGKQIDSDILYS